MNMSADNEVSVLEKRKPNKFARFLTVLGFLAFLAGLFFCIAPLAGAFYVVFLILIAISTLGLLFFNKDFRELFDKGKGFTEYAAKQLFSNIPYAAAISLGLCVLSLLLLIPSKKASNRVSGIVINSILIFFNVILFIVYFWAKKNIN